MFLVVLCSVVLAGCGVPFVGAMTPEQAALRNGAMLVDGQQLQPQIAGKRQLPNGHIIVLYRADMVEADGQATYLFGYSLVQRQGVGWGSGSGGAGGGPKPTVDQLVNLGSGSSMDGRTTYALVYGETLTPDVVAVEATFDNGQTLRDSAADGVFVVYSANANAVCSTRILGANDVVLRTDDLRPPPDAPKHEAFGPPNNCSQP